jgi:dihydrofolate synthase/folylpolyglutamate synthase
MSTMPQRDPEERTADPRWADALEFLLARKTRGVELGLGRMQRFADALGHPETQVPCVHIAGTNGKGSVAAMLEAVLRAAGWRTGLYTSPHLVRLGERVQVDRAALTDEELASGVSELRPLVHEIERQGGRAAGPSYFEFMTGLAFRHFARRQCDVAVIEVGLGGRQDATNIVNPELSVITSIGLDHCEVLGDTLEAIAREKGGIIKPGRPVVIGRVPEVAERILREIAGHQGSPVHSVGEVFGHDASDAPRTNLAGEFQRSNAATALLASRVLAPRWRLDDGLVRRALQHVNWPGRWQRIMLPDHEVIVDASHNEEGAEVLGTELAALAARAGDRLVAVVGALGERRARAILAVVCRYAREVYLVVPDQRRACSIEQLRALVPTAYAGAVRSGAVSELFPGPRQCRAGRVGETVVVTGSIYLAGEVLARLEPERGAVQSQLQDF